MRIIPKIILLSASVGLLTFPRAWSASSYFRADLGLARGVGTLPDRLDGPEALRWQVATDAGHSTPVLCGDKIFLTTYRAEDQELATVGLNRANGKVLWKRIRPVVRLEQFHRATGSPAAATPACDGERLYVFFGSYGLICYDLDGKPVWERSLGPFQDEFGAGSSPVLIDNKVILSEDHDRDSFLLAVDARTGTNVWKVSRPDAVRSYSTPTFWTWQGRQQLLVAGAIELAAYDPGSGEKLWWVDGLARIVIPVPVPVGDMIFTASWTPGGDPGSRLALDNWPAALAKWDRNGDGKLAKSEIDSADVLDRFFRMDLDQSGDLDQKEWERHAAVFRRAQNAALGLRPGSGRGDLTETAVVWKHQRGAPYVASPLVHNGIFWMVKDGGLVTKLDCATGQTLQEERLPGLGGSYASPVLGDGKVYFASELGVVSIVADQHDWQLLSSRDLHEKIYATPVLAEDGIFVRTERSLFCFGDSARRKPEP